jgi:predicted transcriptional regulator
MIEERLKIKKRILALNGFVDVLRFGKALGKSQANFSMYLHGKRGLTSKQIDTLHKLCEQVELCEALFNYYENQNKMQKNGQITE